MKRFIFICFLILTLNNFAQELHFEKLDLKNLPSTETYEILQDKQGFIWIATDAGLCKYDGNNLITYTVKDGIPENVILFIKEDAQNRVWFLTLSGYFFYYENEKFVQIAANAELKKISATIRFPAFFFGEKDTLCILQQTTDYSLLKVPPQQNYGNVIRLSDSITDKVLRYIIKQSGNASTFILGNGKKLFSKDSIYNFYLFDSIIHLSLKGLIGATYNLHSNHETKIGADGTIYLITRNQLALLKNYKVKQYHYFPADIIELYIDRDNDLWIGTKNHGIYLYKNCDLNTVPIRCLTSYSVSSIFLDKEGTVWVTTLEKGVFQCMNKYVYTLYEKVVDLNMFNNKLVAFFLDQKELLVTSKDSFHFINSPKNLQKGQELVCAMKNNYATYYGFYNQLMEVTNQSTNEIKLDQRITKRVYLNCNKPSVIDLTKKAVVAKSLINLSGDTILGANNTGMFFTAFHSEIISHYTTPFSIKFIVRSPDNRIFFSSRSGLGIVELKNNKIIPFLDHLKELKTRINWISIDSFGNFWIATNEKGLYCYDKKKQQLRVFDENNGLISNKVNTCVVAPNGDIWCGTHSGLSKLTTSSGFQNFRIENFNKNHGIVDLEIEKIAWHDDAIWCAGKTAFFFFPIDKMKKNALPPGVYLKSLTIKENAFPLTDTVFLKYDQNDFRVQYEMISSKKVNAPLFFYKLDGYDQNWRTSRTGDIQYTGIKNGTYTLLVYSTNNDGLKSSAPQTLTFVIQKPFWYTWWFILIEVVVTGVIFYYFLNVWKRKIEKKEQEKMKIEQEKTKMNQKIAEFKMTALRSQMNPHFIFNAIGSIQHFILQNEAKQSYNYLAKFAMLIRNILNNSREEFISLEQEVITLRLYIELEQIRFETPFHFNIEIDETLDMEMDIPTMLIQPYLENSIWHGLMPKKSEGILELLFKKVNGDLHIIIKDNGVGRKKKDSSQKHISRGMSITEQRIETLEATSQKKFKTFIVDLKDENGNATGTEVNIIIPIDEK